MSEYISEEAGTLESIVPGVASYKAYKNTEEYSIEGSFKEGFRKSAFGEFFGLNPNTESSFETEITVPTPTPEDMSSWTDGGLLQDAEGSFC